MFVQNLNERQQGVLLHYADEVMRVDKRIDAAELMAMEVLRNQSEPGVKAEDVPIEQLPDLFEDRLSRVSFLLELVGMGYANEDFDPEQSKLVGQIAEVFSFREDGTEEAIEAWVKGGTRPDEGSTTVDGGLRDAVTSCSDWGCRRGRCCGAQVLILAHGEVLTWELASASIATWMNLNAVYCWNT